MAGCALTLAVAPAPGLQVRLLLAWRCASGPAFRGGEVTTDHGPAACEGPGGSVGASGEQRPGPLHSDPEALQTPWGPLRGRTLPLTGGLGGHPEPPSAESCPLASSARGQWPADRMPEAPARFKLRFSREMRTVSAAACVPLRAIIRLPKYKNISQFVLFMEHSISTWKGAPWPASWLRSTVPSRPAVRALGALGPPGGSLPYPGPALARAPPTSPDVCGHGRVQPPQVGGPRGTGHPRPSGSVGHGRSVCSPGVLVFIFQLVKYTHRKSCHLNL